MKDVILTVNAGSSNTKIGIYDAGTLNRQGKMQFTSLEAALAHFNETPYRVTSVGHRVVHGGGVYTDPVLATPEVMNTLRAFIPLAPLHQPANLAAIEQCGKLWPNAPQIACFDTAFHHTLNPLERCLPLPQSVTGNEIRRYGFHGLSYQHIASALPSYAGKKARTRVIVAHLGGGASMCAMRGLQSVACSMGFSTLDGLMMGTRSGAIDPGVIFHLVEQKNMPLKEVEHLLYHDSGLKGVSGISDDIRELERHSNPQGRQAIELYCYLAAKQLYALMPALGGLDLLVFTGGIGEHSSLVRANICHYLRWTGLRMSNKRNKLHARIISTPNSKIPVYMLPADEEAVIAEACANYLQPA